MRTSVLGVGWVTPLGNDLDQVTIAIERGNPASVAQLAGPRPTRSYPVMRVPSENVKAVQSQSRLRRTSVITHFAATAGLAALADAGGAITAGSESRIALVFAAASGSVVYTRRFFDQWIHGSPASPLLFPETVYNAPASHLAAILGLTGETYTLVGDGAVGLSALHFAAQLLAGPEVDYVLLVGAEEVDGVICEAYATWKLNGIYSEGAGALLLGREGRVQVRTHPGMIFQRRKDALSALGRVCDALTDEAPDLVVSGSTSHVMGQREESFLRERYPHARRVAPKQVLGESLGASALQQAVFAVHALRTGKSRHALVASIGVNEQACAASFQ